MKKEDLEMKYENAYKGVSKIFSAQILRLLAGIFGVISAVFAVFTLASAMAGSLGGTAGFGIGTIVLLVLIAVFSIIAFILMLVGTGNAGKDEPFFKTALLWLMIGIIASIASSCLSTFPVGASIFKIIATVADILSTFYIISGIVSLADKIGNTDVSAKGNLLMKMIIAVYVIAIIIEIISLITKLAVAGAVIAGILGIIAAVLSVVSYILFLVLLSRAKKMLANA